MVLVSEKHILREVGEMKRIALITAVAVLLSLVLALPALAGPKPEVLERAFSHSTEAAKRVQQIVESKTGKNVELHAIEIVIHGRTYYVDPIYIWCD